MPRVEITRPPRVVGQDTVTSIQAGLFYGYAGLVDGIVENMRRELDFPVTVVATGGLASLICHGSRTIECVDELLTLRGLRLLYSRGHTL